MYFPQIVEIRHQKGAGTKMHKMFISVVRYLFSGKREEGRNISIRGLNECIGTLHLALTQFFLLSGSHRKTWFLKAYPWLFLRRKKILSKTYRVSQKCSLRIFRKDRMIFSKTVFNSKISVYPRYLKKIALFVL